MPSCYINEEENKLVIHTEEGNYKFSIYRGEEVTWDELAFILSKLFPAN